MFTIVLIGPESDGNIGAVCRSMKNFGIKNLIMVNPKAPLTDEVKAYSMHAYDVYRTAKKEKTLHCLKRFDLSIAFTGNVNTGSGIRRIPVPLKDLKDILTSKKIALVFGRESIGLTNAELETCDIISTIPANPQYPTMNLSHAVTIVLYELTKNAGPPSNDKASISTKKRLLNYFNTHVDNGSFKNPDVIKLSFRRIIARSGITEKEAKAVLTIFSRLLKKK